MKKALWIIGLVLFSLGVGMMVASVVLDGDLIDTPLDISVIIIIAFGCALLIVSVFYDDENEEKKQKPIKLPFPSLEELNALQFIPNPEIKELKQTQSLIIKRLEAMPMPKAKFQNMTKVIYQNEIVRIVRKQDWALQYCIETKNGLLRVYEDELTSLDDYAKEQKKK